MKNVLITGASRGIGAACAVEFAERGYRVFINYNKSADEAAALAEKTGGIPVKCDVANEDEVRAMIDTLNAAGGADVLINNAGVSQIKMLCDTISEDYDRIFDVNMRGVYLVTKYAMGNMVSKKSGKIINISSMWGQVGASCEALYSASKAAVIGFTKAMAKELGPSGINVNCIAPGVIATRMNSALDAETVAALKDETPLMRIGTPEDIAKTAAFLASDGAAFITGQVISADGGYAL
ncbi:MAG: 3-oxoacyl-ACP reductase FabG [Firmicutes bacterium]|nr:3-oxoacyl-ACP reductase FabG [Bacillota bacterium]